MPNDFKRYLFSCMVFLVITGCSTVSTQPVEPQNPDRNAHCTDHVVLTADLTQPNALNH